MRPLYSRLSKKATAFLVTLVCFLAPTAAAARVPNDPGYGSQAAMWNQVGAPSAWNATIGSPDVVVAVIDTGVDVDHPDLSANIWTNPNEIPDNGVDDDNNGFIDDVHGWNFVENNNNVNPATDASAEPDPDAVRHGTIAAGVIGAVGDNARDGAGLNWRVRIMPLRAIKSSGAGYTGTVISAIQYAIENGVDVISLSFVGSERIDQFYSVLKEAYDAGIVVVAAAGNHGPGEVGDLDVKPLYPVCYNREAGRPIVIGVGSVSPAGYISRFSDYGRCVDIVAPGEQIFSTYWYDPTNSYTASFGGPSAGTSYATPFVAGAAALLKSVRPDWGPYEIAHALTSTATAVPGQITAGRLAVDQAVALATAAPLIGTPLTRIYYPLGQNLLAYDLVERTPVLVTRVREATLVAVAQKPTALVRAQELAVLMRRGTYYYIQRLRTDGTRISEFAVAAERGTAEGVAWQKQPGGTDRILLKSFDKKRNQTIFTAYTTAGIPQGERRMRGTVAAWTPSTLNPDLYVAAFDAKRKTLVVQLAAWDGSTTSTQKFAKVDTVDSIAAGQFFGRGSEQLALIVRTGTAIRQIIADVATQSFRQESLGVQPVKAFKPILIAVSAPATGDRQDIVRYKARGGPAVLASTLGDVLTTWDFPDFTKFR